MACNIIKFAQHLTQSIHLVCFQQEQGLQYADSPSSTSLSTKLKTRLRKAVVVALVAFSVFDAARLAPAQTLVASSLTSFTTGIHPTYHYNNSRMGANTSETILTPANVNRSQFGKLFSLPVDAGIYAQPLYVPNRKIPGLGTHNVVYVATQHNSLLIQG